MGKYKRKADCTPEEWEERLKKNREHQKKFRKHKCDYTPEEWEVQLSKHREYQRHHAKHKQDYTEEEWRALLDYNKKHTKHKKDMSESELKEYNKRKNENRKRRYALMSEEEKKEFNKRRQSKMTIKQKQYRAEKAKEWVKLHHEQYLKYRRKYYKNILRKRRDEYDNETLLQYEKYYKRLTVDEDPIQDENGFLMVRDFYTKEYFYPRRRDVVFRIRALNGTMGNSEHHLYSSKESKIACPVYKKIKYPAYKNNSQIKIDPYWRKTVIERAAGHCERCGKASDVLHAHHIIPKGVCGMFEADFDNGIALCPECHLGEGGVHDIDGCRLHELAAEKREAS